jgi:hypothetical protein
MTFTHLDAEMCAQIADLCCAAGRPELTSGFIRDHVHPMEVRKRLQQKPAASAAPFDTAGRLDSPALEAAAAERFGR